MILPWSWQDSTRDLMTSFLSSKSLPNKGCVYICKYTSTHMHTHHKSMFSIRHTQPFFCQLCSPCITLKKKRNGYHGAGPYCGGLTALNTWRFPLAGGFGIHHVGSLPLPPSPFLWPVSCLGISFQATTPDVFRGPWGGANCRDSIAQTQRKCNCPEGTPM